jgi:hypothetical protein
MAAPLLLRRLRGRLIELFDDGWAITEWGIESLTGSAQISREAMVLGLGGGNLRPEEVAQEYWVALLHVADQTFQESARA